MLNFLMICSNLNSVKYLLNSIFMGNSNIKLYAVSSSIYEAIKILSTNSSNIDLIVLDINICKVNKFLNLLERNIKKDYSNCVIILTNNKLEIKNIDHNYFQINKNEKYTITNNINKLINKKMKNESKIKEKQIIINYLYKLGYNFSHLGTKYLAEIISILMQKNITKCPKLESIYYIISQKYDTNPHNVKCLITLATKHMNYNCKIEDKQIFLPYLEKDYIYTKTVINVFLLKYDIYKK